MQSHAGGRTTRAALQHAGGIIDLYKMNALSPMLAQKMSWRP